MQAVKKTITYVDVSIDDLQNFYEQKDKVNDEGMVISEFSFVNSTLEKMIVTVTYIDECRCQFSS